MNKNFKYLFLLMVMIVILAIPGTAMAKELQDDEIVTGFPFILSSEEVLDGNLVVLGSTASIENQSIVEGDVVVLGGIVTIDGEVEGNVAGIGGVVNLDKNAVIHGDLLTLAASLNQDQDAVVMGNVIDNVDFPALALLPQTFDIPSYTFFQPTVAPEISLLWRIFWFVFRTLLWGALAALVVLILPNQTEVTSNTIAGKPILSGGLGLVTVIIAPVILIILAITCIFSPVSLLGAFVLAVAWIFGIIAIGLEIGQRIAKVSNREWALPVLAGIGTIGLVFIVDGIGLLVPPGGWFLRGFVGIFGLGAVLLTRFGTQSYPAEEEFGEAEELPPPSGLEEIDETPAEGLVASEDAAPEEPSDEAPES
jgi:hypothetical protein